MRCVTFLLVFKIWWVWNKQGVEPNPNLNREPVKIAFFPWTRTEPEPFKFEIIEPEPNPNL